MADQAPPGVNMPKKRDPRLRQMQAPQQQQFFDSADYEVRKQQQQQQRQAHGQMAHGTVQQRPAPAAEGGARGAYGNVPLPPPQQQQPQQYQPQYQPQYQQRQYEGQYAAPPAPPHNSRMPANMQSPTY